MFAVLLIGQPLATEWELGLGARDALDQADFIDGPRLIGRMDRGAFALEANGFLNPMPARWTALDTAMVDLESLPGSSGSTRIRTELAAAQVVGDLGFLPITSGGEAPMWSGGPHLYLGAEANLWRGATLSGGWGSFEYTPDDKTRLAFGAVGGAGVDLWLQGHVGVRFSWTARVMWGNAGLPSLAPTRCLDLLVAL